MDDKKDKNSKINKKILKYFWEKTLTQKRRFCLYVILVILTCIISIIIPKIYSQIMDISVQLNINNELISQAISIIVIAIFLDLVKIIIVRGFILFLFTKLRYQIRETILIECFTYLMNHSYRFFLDETNGSLLSKLNKLPAAYETFFLIFFERLLNVVVYLAGIIGIVLVKNIFIGVIFIVYGFIMVGISLFFAKKEEKYDIMRSSAWSKSSGILSDNITNIYNILTFSSQNRELERYGESLSYIKDINIERDVIHLRRNILLQLIDAILMVGILIISIKFREFNIVELSIVVLLQNYISKVQYNVGSIIQSFKRINNMFGNSIEMLEILNTPHEIEDKTDKKLKVIEGKIEFERVKFGYDKEEMVLRDFSLRIKPGEKIALVGQSGSGKSTLTKLLFRFYDIQGGIIKIDDQDISQVTQESLRNEISIVPQDVVLFHRSIKENICYGNPTATEEEMIAACKMARCHEFIIKLENGYDTLVGERGIKLSGGERQRVAIARAILENKKILVMDEATSSLDSESEKCIQDAMDEVMKNKTCIVIAHRLSTINKMDKIIVMDDGKIVEKGSHNVLIKNEKGIYHKLWSIQSGGFLSSEEEK